MKEETYFDHSGVRVTDARLVAPKETFSIAGISSVKIEKENAAPYFSFVLIVGGLVALAVGKNIWAVVVPIAIGVALCFLKPNYHVVVASNGKDKRALNSKDKAFIEAVVSAINQAMIGRQVSDGSYKKVF